MTTADYYNAAPADRDRMVAEARARIAAPAPPAHRGEPRTEEHPMPCNYCGLPTPDGGEFHPICRLEVGPLHSCPDCHTSPCTACNPEEQQ